MCSAPGEGQRRIYDVVGLESEGRRSTSRWDQLLPLRHQVRQLLGCGTATTACWRGTTTRTAGATSRRSSARVGRSLEDEWQRWIAWERDFQRATWSGSAASDHRRAIHLGPRAGRGLPAFYDPAPNHLPACAIPARWATSPPRHPDRQITNLHESWRGDSASPPWRSTRPHAAVLHHQQRQLAHCAR